MGSHVHPATIPWKIITNIWANIKSRFLQKHLPLVIIKYPINNSKKTPSTMKNLLIFTVTLLIPLCSCSQTENTDTDEPVIPPPSNNYVLQGSMQGSAELVEAGYTQIHQYMRKIGWDYSEHPNSSSLDHKDGVHGEVIYDLFIRQYIFKLSIHANEKALDGDRGKLIDRQRNEMKTQTTPSWYKLNGNWDEWQQLKWKFKIPKDFRPSGSFTHLHQLKAQEGNNGSPVITITARSNGNGSNRRIQIIHNGDTEETTKGTIIDNLPLEDFEDEWIQVETEMHYTHNGSFSITLSRLSDGKRLVQRSFDDLDLWRKGAISIRNKFGIYRSFGKTLTDENDRPTNGIKDEHILLADFKVYEKNTNPDPQPHD